MQREANPWIRLAGALCLAAFLFGCGPVASTVVQLNRENYIPKIDAAPSEKWKGKRLYLTRVVNGAANTSTFAYYNRQGSVGYALYYSHRSMPQPVESFFWYMLQKGFEQAGVGIDEHGRVYDAELSIVLQSLTDEEVRFAACLAKAGKSEIQKRLVVTIPPNPTKAPHVLEERAYRMVDGMVAAILSDPDFQKAL